MHLRPIHLSTWLPDSRQRVHIPRWAKSRTWRSAFVDPEHGSVAKFTGGPVGNDRYVLETPDLGSKQTRWSFYDIRSDSFAVSGEASSDDGKTWKLESEYKMKRRAN